MKTIQLAFSLCAIVAVGGLACATHYKHDAPASLLFGSAPPLAFADFPYTSTEDRAWPMDRVKLPGVAEIYNLKAVPELAYVELNPEGETTLIFIHGLGSYLKFWRYQLDHFAQRGFRVLALDMLGYGKSDKPASFPYTMEAMADVVHEFAQAKTADKPVLVGHSMGGQTALSFAIRFPDKAQMLILASPAGFEKFSARDKQWYRSVLKSGAIKASPEYNIWGSVRRANFNNWRDEYQWLIEERVRVAATPEFSSYAYANVKSINGLADNDFVRDNLDKVKVPTLIVYGDRDRLIPNRFFSGGFTSSIMEYGHAQITPSELVGLSGCGHTLQMDCSDDFNSAVIQFFKTHLERPSTREPRQPRRSDDSLDSVGDSVHNSKTPSPEPETAPSTVPGDDDGDLSGPNSMESDGTY